VAAILGGGLEVRTRAGVPPFGHVVHRPFSPRILVGVVGRAMPSPSVLRDRAALQRITDASRGWESLGSSPSVGRFFRFSERFTDRAGLASSQVARIVTALRRRGAFACQAMFGESFFAHPRSAAARAACVEWLEDEGIRAVEVRASTTGGHAIRPTSGAFRRSREP